MVGQIELRAQLSLYRSTLAVLVALTLAGCVSPPPSDAAARPPNAGGTALAVIGTPFYIAAKIPTCGVAAAIAAPLAAISQLAGDYHQGTIARGGGRINDDLADGLAFDCGP